MPQQHRALNGSTGPGQQLQQDPSTPRQKAPQYFQDLRTLSVRDIAHTLSASSLSSFSSIDSPIKAIAWNAVGTRVACAHADRSISIWPVADAAGNMGSSSASDQKSSRASNNSNSDLLVTVVLRSAHDRSIEGISWDPLHPNRLASCSADGAVRIWDTAPHLTNPLNFSSSQMSGSRVRSIANAASSSALLATTSTDIDNYVVKYSPCGQFLGIGTRSDQVIIYHILKEYKIVPVSQLQENQNHNGRRSKNSNQNSRISSQANKPKLVITLVKLCSHKEHDEIYDLCWSNTSNIFALSLGNGNIRIFLFDFKEVLESQKASDVKSTNQSTTDDVAMTDIPADINNSLSSNSKIEASLQVFHTLRGHRTAASCVAFDPKGCYIAVGSNEGIVSLWDISSSDFICFRTFNKPDHAISSISISHDGMYIAIGVEGASGNTSNSIQPPGHGSSVNLQNIGDMPIIIGCVESGEYVHSIDYPHFFLASGSSISAHGSGNNLNGLAGGPDVLNYSGSLPHSGGGTPNINGGIPRSDAIDYGSDHLYPISSSNTHINHNLQLARSKGTRPLVMWHPLRYYLLYSADMTYSSGSGGSGGSAQTERGGSLPLMILGRF